jgi:mono/diheme cytochrome c family protein
MTTTKRADTVVGSAVAALLLFTASQARADAATEAKDIFATRCSTCHGPQGKGDGPAGVALNPKPRDFADPAWQKSVTDEHIEKIIVGGGPAVGKSPLMPPNPDLASKPDVVKALTAYIRGLSGK